MSAAPDKPPAAPTLRAVPDAPTREPQTRWSDEELLSTEFPPPIWAVPGLISEGLNILVGAPKLGKSWLSLGLAASVAGGTRALGDIDVAPGPVLYLALEDNPRRLQRRRRTMLAGGGDPCPDLTLELSCPPLNAGGEAVLSDWLDTHPHARLVIVDTLEKIRSRTAASSSAYGDDYSVIARIKQIADHYAVPILLVHHVRKQGADDYLATVSGTNGITGAADTLLVLERPRGQADAVLHVTGRDVEEADHALSFDPATGAWTRLDGPALEHTVSDTRATILRHLRDHPGQGPASIARATGLDREQAKKTCQRMADAGQLHVDTGGRYRPIDTGENAPALDLSPESPPSPKAP